MRASLALLAAAALSRAAATDSFEFAPAPVGASDAGPPQPVSASHISAVEAWVGYPEGLWKAVRSSRADAWGWEDDHAAAAAPYGATDGATMKVCYGYMTESLTYKLDCQWTESAGNTKWWTLDTSSLGWSTASSGAPGRRIEAEGRARRLVTVNRFWDNTNNGALTTPAYTGASALAIRTSTFISTITLDASTISSDYGATTVTSLSIPLASDPFATPLIYNVTFRLWRYGTASSPSSATDLNLQTPYYDQVNQVGVDIGTFGKPYQTGNANYPSGLTYVSGSEFTVSSALGFVADNPMIFRTFTTPSSWVIDPTVARWYKISVDAVYEKNANFPTAANCASLGYSNTSCATLTPQAPFNVMWQYVLPDGSVSGYSDFNTGDCSAVGAAAGVSPCGSGGPRRASVSPPFSYRGYTVLSLSASTNTFATSGNVALETAEGTFYTGSGYSQSNLQTCTGSQCPATPGLRLTANYNPSPSPSPFNPPAPSPQPCPCYSALWGPSWAY